MYNEVSINYYSSIKSLVTPENFRRIKKRLSKDSNERLEAFWSFIVAGYPVDFAMENYQQLHAFLKNKPIGYSEALTTFSVYPGLSGGIYITKTKWYELN